jgi:hypothetical protein
MAFNQNNSHPKQGEAVTKLADAAKRETAKLVEQASSASENVRVGVHAMADLHEKAAVDTKQLFQNSIEAATLQANEASVRVTRALGFSGEGSERLVEQSNKNMDIVARCGTALTQALQDTSRSWLELSQKQWHRNLEGMQRLAGSKSVQEFTTTQTELLRESLEHVVQDSQAIAATSLKAMEQARDTFVKAPHQI